MSGDLHAHRIDEFWFTKENEILDEIHRYREEHARAFGYDIHKIFADIRRNTAQLKAEGWNVVSPAPHQPEPASALREEPPKP